MELKVRAAHEQSAASGEDLKSLMDAAHSERAAREEAERALAADTVVVDGLKEDWQRKLRDRRKEVRNALQLRIYITLPVARCDYHRQQLTADKAVKGGLKEDRQRKICGTCARRCEFRLLLIEML